LENAERCAFDLRGPDDSIIIPQVWESLAKPGWTVTIEFKYGYPSRPKSPPPWHDTDTDSDSTNSCEDDGTKSIVEIASGEENALGDQEINSQSARKPRYDRVVQHTVEFYHQRHPGYKPEFLFEKNKSESITFYDPSKHATVLPILQEVVTVIRNESGSYMHHGYQKPRDKTKPSSRPVRLHKGDRIGDRYLIIRSLLLLNALRAVISYSSEPPSGDKDSLNEGYFPFPYRDLCQYKNELLEYKTSHPSRERHSDAYNAECDSHIDALIDYLYSQNEIRLKEAEERWNRRNPTTTFGSLWLLMRSGSNVYAREQDQLNAYVIESMIGGPKRNGRADPYTFRVWNLEFDGRVVSRTMKSITIPVFDGERDITSLPLFPVRFHRDEPGQQPLRDQLIERGEKYLQLVKGPSFRQYSGRGLDASMQTVCQSHLTIVRF
jgi:hypothetical protein